MNIAQIKDIHKDFVFTGRYPNELLDLNPIFLQYLLHLLHDKEPLVPKADLDEWMKFLDVLAPHGILPLLSYKINKNNSPHKPPQEIVNELKRIYLSSSARSMIMEKHFIEIAKAFNSHGIEFIVLKGLAYARAFYPEPGCRPYSDIDIMIDPNKIEIANKALIGLGFNCTKMTSDNFKLLEIENGYAMQSGANNIIVDLHYGLHSFGNLIKKEDFGKIVNNCIIYKNSYLEFKMLNPQDSLAYGAIHCCLAHNIEMRLIWVYDFKCTIKKLKEVDWQLLKDKFVLSGVRLAVENALRLSDFWTGSSSSELFFKCPAPAKKELRSFQAAIKRQKNLINWLKVRWPKDLSIIENLVLFVKYFKILRKKIIMRLKY